VATKVANPQELLLFNKAKVEKKAADGQVQGAGNSVTHTEGGRRNTGVAIMSVLEEKLREQDNLNIFASSDLGAALSEFVDKDENGAFTQFYDTQIRECQKKLMQGDSSSANNDEGIVSAVQEMRQQREQEAARRQRRKAAAAQTPADDDDEISPPARGAASNASRRAAPAAAAPKRKGRSKNKAPAARTGSEDDDGWDSDAMDFDGSAPTKTKQPKKPRGGAQKKQARQPSIAESFAAPTRRSSRATKNVSVIAADDDSDDFEGGADDDDDEFSDDDVDDDDEFETPALPTKRTATRARDGGFHASSKRQKQTEDASADTARGLDEDSDENSEWDGDSRGASQASAASGRWCTRVEVPRLSKISHGWARAVWWCPLVFVLPPTDW
jgi:hypothetical protein